tara:strand:- start:143 stop:328 length:186 start_codon:yes stop_codon:yes gene_type:complete
VIAGGYEQLNTFGVQGPELGRVYPFTEEARSLAIWFDSEMVWDAAPLGWWGCEQVYGDVAI